MKQMKKIVAVLAAVTMVGLLAGCDLSAPATKTSDSVTYKTLQDTATRSGSASPYTYTVTYYSLTTGQSVGTSTYTTTDGQIPFRNNTDWDIAFSSELGGAVFTNSGVSTTLGQGAVYYSGSTDFDSVGSVATTNAGFSGADATDSAVYVTGQAGASKTVINKMTKLAYTGSHAGTVGDPYAIQTDAAQSDYSYNNESYYSYNAAGTNAIVASNEVYYLRHGTGTKVSKVQISSFSGTATSRVRTIKYQTF